MMKIDKENTILDCVINQLESSKEIKNIVPSIKIVLINEDYPGAYQDFSECDILIDVTKTDETNMIDCQITKNIYKINFKKV